MLTQEDILAFLKQNKTTFEKDFNIAKIGLIGSFSRDQQTDASDIDLIVEFKPNTKDLFEVKRQIKEMLGQQFNKHIEICREKYIKSYYRNRILKDAIFV
jgi:uncharacterized protein